MEMVPVPIFLHNQLRRALFNRNWAIYVENNPVGEGGAKWVNFKAFLTLDGNIFLKLVHYPTKTIWLEHLTFDECSLTIFKSSELYLLIYNNFYQQCW